MNYRSKFNHKKEVRVMGEVKVRLAEMRDVPGILYYDAEKMEAFVRLKSEFLAKFEPIKKPKNDHTRQSAKVD
jgi:hypothetical protein